MKPLLILLAIVYVLSPYDFFPDVFLGPGWVDDLIVVTLVWRFLSRLRNANRSYGGYQNGSDARSASGQQAGQGQPGSGAPADAHTILGVSRGATQAEIRSAYRNLALKYHPDKAAHLGEEFRVLAEKRFKEILAAYQELSQRNM